MKNIEISEDIYEMLLELKEPKETIDEVIGKLLDEYYEEINEGKINKEVEDKFEDELYM